MQDTTALLQKNDQRANFHRDEGEENSTASLAIKNPNKFYAELIGYVKKITCSSVPVAAKEACDDIR